MTTERKRNSAVIDRKQGSMYSRSTLVSIFLLQISLIHSWLTIEFSLQQADNFTNSLGILQQFANPSQFTGFGNKTPQQQQQQHEGKWNFYCNALRTNSAEFICFSDYTHLFAQLIARTAKDIEVLIDSLPAEESSADLQAASLQSLESENQEASNKLEDIVQQGEAVLQEIQSALHDIAQSQLEMQKLEAQRPWVRNGVREWYWSLRVGTVR